MLDLIFLTVIISFFVGAIGYLNFCSRLNKSETK
jgi:hypothetical protein